MAHGFHSTLFVLRLERSKTPTLQKSISVRLYVSGFRLSKQTSTFFSERYMKEDPQGESIKSTIDDRIVWVKARAVIC